MMIDKLPVGSQAPDFSLLGTDGLNYTLDSFKSSKLLVVIFSCNHCPYVRAYEDRIIALQKKYPVTDVQVIAISSNNAAQYPEDSFEAMKQRHMDAGYNFPYLYDASQTVAKSFLAEFTPEVFLFDTDRKLAYYGKIDDNWNTPDKVKTRYLQNAIDLLLGNGKVAVPETYAIGCTIKWKI